MERDEMLVVSAEVVHSKKSDTDFCILNGIYTDNFGKLTSKPIMTTPDVQKGFDGCGVYKIRSKRMDNNVYQSPYVR